MSTLNQFFPSAGGSSSSGPEASNAIRTRVQVTEGGHGATCICLDLITPTLSCTRGTYQISGRGGGVADFNLNIQPGTTCAITVGYGGTSYGTPFNIGPTNNFLPSDTYPTAASTSNCGPYLCGRFGNLGAPSKFGALGFYPNGTRTSTVYRACPASGVGTYCLCITNNYFPSVNLSCLCPTDNILEQNVPCTSVGEFTEYTEFDKGFRGFDLPSGYSCCTKVIPTNSCCCVCQWCCSGLCTNYGPVCYAVGKPGGGADNFKQIDRWSGGVYTEPAPSTCAGRIQDAADCGGYTSYITGAACSYGVGGFVVEPLEPGSASQQSAYLDAPCAKCYCNDTHGPFRFPGSGAGGSSVYCHVLLDPTVPCDPVCPGTPGSVIVQYPTCYAAAVATSPSVIDCSPNTPGFRTYKFLCPGTIQFP